MKQMKYEKNEPQSAFKELRNMKFLQGVQDVLQYHSCYRRQYSFSNEINIVMNIIDGSMETKEAKDEFNKLPDDQ